MSSMTDIVFLLLIFFLVTSTLINPNALKLLLPKSTGQVSAKATVSVSIADHGDGYYTYHINGDRNPVQFVDIEEDLIGLLQDQEDPTFSIFADDRTGGRSGEGDEHCKTESLQGDYGHQAGIVSEGGRNGKLQG